MARIEELGDGEMLTLFLMLDFIELIVMKGVCKRLRDFLQSRDFMTRYNELGRRMIRNHTHFYAGRRFPDSHKVIAIREDDKRRICFTLNDLHAEILDLMDVWNGILVFHQEGFGFVLYNLWMGNHLRVYCRFHGEMRDFHEMQTATKLTLAPGDVLRYVISSVHCVSADRRRPLLRFFSHDHPGYPSWASSTLVHDVLAANELDHPLRRIFPMSRQHVAVVSLGGRGPCISLEGRRCVWRAVSK